MSIFPGRIEAFRTGRWQNVEYFAIVSDLPFIVIKVLVSRVFCFVIMTFIAHVRFLLKFDSVYSDLKYK